jgi:hypothetical protein
MPKFKTRCKAVAKFLVLAWRDKCNYVVPARHASLCSLATQFQTLFLALIPRPIAGLKFSALGIRTVSLCSSNY